MWDGAASFRLREKQKHVLLRVFESKDSNQIILTRRRDRDRELFCTLYVIVESNDKMTLTK